MEKTTQRFIKNQKNSIATDEMIFNHISQNLVKYPELKKKLSDIEWYQIFKEFNNAVKIT